MRGPKRRAAGLASCGSGQLAGGRTRPGGAQAPKRPGVARLEKGQELLPDLAAQVEGYRGVQGAGQDADFHAIGFEIGNLEREHPAIPAFRRVHDALGFRAQSSRGTRKST